MLRTVIPMPNIVRKILSPININALVLRRVMEQMSDNETLEENRRLIHFDEKFHDEHPKFNALYSKGCGCEYCQTLHQYSVMVVELHRLERRRDAYYDSNLRDSWHILKSMAEVRRRRDEYRAKKEALKRKVFLSRT